MKSLITLLSITCFISISSLASADLSCLTIEEKERVNYLSTLPIYRLTASGQKFLEFKRTMGISDDEALILRAELEELQSKGNLTPKEEERINYLSTLPIYRLTEAGQKFLEFKKTMGISDEEALVLRAELEELQSKDSLTSDEQERVNYLSTLPIYRPTAKSKALLEFKKTMGISDDEALILRAELEELQSKCAR